MVDIRRLSQDILAETEKIIVGKADRIRLVIMAVLADGHILLDDLPGVGKTTLVKTISIALGCRSGRIQFVPDLLPSDIIGMRIYNQKTGDFELRQGPVMTNLLLADEINRAIPRTQSALLEAMEEGQVTVDGVSHAVPSPFIVIATQNPTGAAGTQLLPDSQIDRFMMRLSLGYPAPKDEAAMVLGRQGGNPLEELTPVMTGAQLQTLRKLTAQTYIDKSVVDYIVALMDATRRHPRIRRGGSPRATLAVAGMARAVARLRGRDYVVPRDVGEVFSHTLAHRLLLTPQAQAAGDAAEELLAEILAAVPAPRLR